MAASKTTGPLTERHYNDLRRIQKDCAKTREFLSKCDKCKIDVSTELAATDDQLQVTKLLLQEFFPSLPRDL